MQSVVFTLSCQLRAVGKKMLLFEHKFAHDKFDTITFNEKIFKNIYCI